MRKTLSRLILALAVAAAVIAANALASRYDRAIVHKPEDVTLAPRTVKALRAVGLPVRVTSFLPAGGHYFSRTLFAMAKQLLNEFQTVMGEDLLVELVDPALHPEQMEQAAERTGRAENELADAVLFECHGRHTLVPGPGIAHFEYGQTGPEVYFRGESAFLQAILAVTGRLDKRVYFTHGSGEMSPVETGGGGLSGLAAMLAELSIPVLRATLAGGIPEDCDLLIVAGAGDSIAADARENLEAYISSGGALLVLASPGAGPALGEPLGAFDIELTDGKVSEADGYTDNAGNILCTTFSEHVVTDPLRQAGVTCGLSDATPVGVGKVTSGWLLASSPGASVSPGDVGVVGLAAWGMAPGGGRAVVVGSAGFASNAMLERFPANAEFLRNACLWLLDTSDFVPKRMESPPVFVISRRMARVLLYLVLITPVTVLVLGVIVRVVRK